MRLLPSGHPRTGTRTLLLYTELGRRNCKLIQHALYIKAWLGVCGRNILLSTPLISAVSNSFVILGAATATAPGEQLGDGGAKRPRHWMNLKDYSGPVERSYLNLTSTTAYAPPPQSRPSAATSSLWLQTFLDVLFFNLYKTSPSSAFFKRTLHCWNEMHKYLGQQFYWIESSSSSSPAPELS